jgi:RNA polymerase sigma-70 factor (ECF subfamily)
MSHPSDDLLVERLKRGDAAAVIDLERAYGARILTLARRYLKNYEDAQEVAQDVLLKVTSKIGRFRGDSALG